MLHSISMSSVPLTGFSTFFPLSVRSQWFDSMFLRTFFGMVLKHGKNFLWRTEKGWMEFKWHWCPKHHCFCFLQEQFHWHYLSTPEVPNFQMPGCWLTQSRLQRKVLEMECKVSIWGSNLSIPVWGPWAWLSIQWRAPAACGAWGEVFMATHVARQMDDCVLFLLPCSWGSWLHFQI